MTTRTSHQSKLVLLCLDPIRFLAPVSSLGFDSESESGGLLECLRARFFFQLRRECRTEDPLLSYVSREVRNLLALKAKCQEYKRWKSARRD